MGSVEDAGRTAIVDATDSSSLALDATATVRIPAYLEGFAPLGANELARTVMGDDGRSTTNLMASFDPERPTEIVVYATPNGNTIEQTLGRKRNEGESFRYDIQHVLAQVRRYRTLVPEKNVVLVVLEAPDLSWPAWVARHADAPTRARSLLLGQVPFARSPRYVLVSHSGGGSLVLRALDGGLAIPEEVDKLVFLDSHYAYEPKSGHGKKLAAWLRAAPSHRLVVLAYDDRKIRLHGRRVVSPTGGSFRATKRMLASLESERVRLTRDTVGPFERTRALEGRIDVRVHPNRENRILHSALVSDENGLGFSLGLGGGPEVEAKARFGRPRAFDDYVEPAPEVPIGEVTADAAQHE